MKTKYLVQISLIAAIYAVLTALFMAISFTALQLRISEVMMFLAYFNPLAIIGLTLGCFIANLLMSPMPLWDCIFGTLATFISVIAIHLTAKVFKRTIKGMLVASIWPVLFNGVIIGVMLCLIGLVPLEGSSKVITLLVTICSVGFGELVVVMIVGIPITYLLMTKYKKVVIQYLTL